MATYRARAMSVSSRGASPTSFAASSSPPKAGRKRRMRRLGKVRLPCCWGDLRGPSNFPSPSWLFLAALASRLSEGSSSSASDTEQKVLKRSNAELKQRVAELEALMVLAAQRLYAPAGDFQVKQSRHWLGSSKHAHQSTVSLQVACTGRTYHLHT